jgi:uncharacterized cupredoxin-like copper-binding protein
MSNPGRPPNLHRLPRLGRNLVVLGSALLFLGGGLFAVATPLPTIEYARPSASGGNPGGSAQTVLSVNLTDSATFRPNALSAVAGSSVRLVLHNLGRYAHSFTLSSLANFTLNRSWTPAQLDAFFARNASLNASLPPQSFDNLTLSVAPSWAGGSFEFASIVPYQFQAGMFGFLNVTAGGGGQSVSVSDQAAVAALSFVPDSIVVNATSFPVTIEVQVSNLGTGGHTWTLVAQPDVNLTPAGFAGYFQAHPPALRLNVPSTPGVDVTGNVTISARGSYQFLCEISGHFAAGMVGYLYVGVPAPRGIQAASTELVAGWALAGAGGILGIGAALSIAAAYVGRWPPTPKESRHP